MSRLTRREAAMSFNSQAPLDMELQAVPAQRAKSTYPEAQLQKACVHYLKLRRNQGDLRFHVSMPEGRRDPKRAGNAKAMGLDSGFVDILVLMHDPAFARRKSVFIELKAPGGRLSDAQKEWQSWLTEKGFEHHVVFSLDELKRIVG